MGFANLSRTINEPRRQQIIEQAKVNEQMQLSNSLTGDESLKTKDTDEDGLSDYDELYFYATSPYLPDSDSDGFSDSEEISSGHDPNCPADNDCRGIRFEEATDVQSDLEGFGITQFDELQTAEGPGDAYVQTTGSLDVTDLSVSELRQLLIDSGSVTQEQLDAIDDDTLQQVYQDVLNGTPADEQAAIQNEQTNE